MPSPPPLPLAPTSQPSTSSVHATEGRCFYACLRRYGRPTAHCEAGPRFLSMTSKKLWLWSTSTLTWQILICCNNIIYTLSSRALSVCYSIYSIFVYWSLVPNLVACIFVASGYCKLARHEAANMAVTEMGHVLQSPNLHLHRLPRSTAVSSFLVLSQSQQVRPKDHSISYACWRLPLEITSPCELVGSKVFALLLHCDATDNSIGMHTSRTEPTTCVNY